MGIEMKVAEINVKSIITKSKLPGTDYVVNPYLGCQHGCIYCYAEFMKRFSDHHEDWGKFVDIKLNASNVLGNLEKYRNKRILFSSVTDAYHPIEGKYRLTRKILEALITAQPKIEILTKSRMVVRDIDILKQFNDATVGVSISTLNEKLSRELEPLAASPDLRVDIVKKCKEAGLKTYVFLSPILPFITEIESIMDLSIDFVDFFMFENLNLRPTNIGKIYKFLRRNRPELIEGYKRIYEGKDNSYFDRLKGKVEKLCRDRNVEGKIYFHHGGFS